MVNMAWPLRYYCRYVGSKIDFNLNLFFIRNIYTFHHRYTYIQYKNRIYSKPLKRSGCNEYEFIWPDRLVPTVFFSFFISKNPRQQIYETQQLRGIFTHHKDPEDIGPTYLTKIIMIELGMRKKDKNYFLTVSEGFVINCETLKCSFKEKLGGTLPYRRICCL